MIDNEKELENGLEEPVQTEKSAQEEVTEMPGASTEKDAPAHRIQRKQQLHLLPKHRRYSSLRRHRCL